MNIILATDHAGFEMKEQLKAVLLEQGYTIQDCGATTYQPDDDYAMYMHFAAQTLQLGLKAQEMRAIVFGGSGSGEAMVCNRYVGVRAVTWYGPSPTGMIIDSWGKTAQDEYEIIRIARMHNDANVLSVGARFINSEQLMRAVEVFLVTGFEGGRHTSRIAEIDSQMTVS